MESTEIVITIEQTATRITNGIAFARTRFIAAILRCPVDSSLAGSGLAEEENLGNVKSIQEQLGIGQETQNGRQIVPLAT